MEQARKIIDTGEERAGSRAEPRAVVRRELKPQTAERPERSHRGGGHLDQLMAAAASVVWLAGFVQSIVDEITGDQDRL